MPLNEQPVSLSRQEEFPMKAEPMPVEAGGRVDNRGTVAIAVENPRNRRILIIADNEISAKLIGDAFEANTYEVLATSDMHAAVRFATTHNPGCILLMLSSLTVTCDSVRQLRPHTATKIIAFSTMPVTAAERDIALQGGCDDYRDAFLRIDKPG
jgi:CheY-like chemotaxis protein